jgi:MFS family permease
VGRDAAGEGREQVGLPPLWRNRDFVLLMAGQLLSTAGSQLTAIAYPLLVLASTHSPAKAGLVGFARILPTPLFGLLAGEAADRWDRKRVMIAADGVRALAIACLGASILGGAYPLWLIVAVAFVEGTGSAFFSAAQVGAVRAAVPARQIPTAIGAQQARFATVSLAGPPAGGALFSLGRSLPFLADAVSYSFSFLTLLAMRTPFQQTRQPDTTPLRSRISEGFRFLWSRSFLRTTTFLYGIGNFALPGILLVIVVDGRRSGLSGARIGALFAVFAAFLLIGSVASPLFRRAFSIRTIILIELCTWLGSGLYLIWPNVYVLTAAILPQAVAMPVTDSVVIGYRIAITPDRLLGRVESVRTTIAQIASPLGPLAAGVLLETTSSRATVAVFTACAVALAVCGMLSPAIRDAPQLAELDGLDNHGQPS